VSYAAIDPRTSVLWAAVNHGHWGPKLQRSRDMARTWEEVDSPKYPQEAEIKPEQPAALSYIWLLAPGGSDQPDRLYAGTEPGGLFQSDDGGDSFYLVETLWNHPSRQEHWFGGGRDQPGICSIVVDPRDGRRVLVGISVGGVFETTDGGESWTPRNRGLVACYLPDPQPEVGHDPHLMLACAAEPDVIWQQNHCGVFRSTDGARSWQNVSQPKGPVNYGFALAVDNRSPLTAWVVPAHSDEQRMAIDGALCVCRTEDGGQSWTELRQGLPQRDCFDLVYRHGLDVSQERLAFGTTTGNLFVSDDRGDSWVCVDQHLPPIYSARFAP
jgi:hypothetical protein